MKKLVKGFLMAVGMYTRIPVPENTWDSEAMRQMSLSLPVVGMIIGFLWYLIYFFFTSFFKVNMALAAILTAYPYLISGFLHLDGFMDTNDAILSRRDLDRRLEILKDSHVGAFGVIAVVLLILLQFSGIYTLILLENQKAIFPLFFTATVSRSLAAVTLIKVTPLKGSSLGAIIKENCENSDVIFILFIVFIASILCYFICGIQGVLYMALTGAAFYYAAGHAYNNFAGFSGDLAGYSITFCECFCVVVLALLS